MWRCLPELNRCKRFCRPLRNHSAKAPYVSIISHRDYNCNNIMPTTTNTVAMRWTRTVLRWSFSRPNLGQINVRSKPMKKMTIGSAESEETEAMAMVGAVIRAPM